MATVQQHITQWKHNRRFLTTIDPPYTDWIVTVVFYVSLHFIDALLAYDKVRGITDHRSRKGVLARTNRYEQINKMYLPLYDLSRTIRYLADPKQWVPFDQIESNILGRYLYPIEKSVQKLIQEELDLKPIVLVKNT